MRLSLHAAILLLLGSCAGTDSREGGLRITHGPILGRPGAREMGVWARTDRPGAFRVAVRKAGASGAFLSDPAETRLERDNTGWILLRGLEPDTEYAFELVPPAPPGPLGPWSGRFRTLPEARPDPKHNPRGLFNYRFEFACGNNQGVHSLGPELGALRKALERFPGGFHFGILNGDWLYEDKRDYTAEEWRRAEGAAELPRVVRLAPPITAVWENYKSYLARGVWLKEWHRRVPSYFTLDDHEIVNDVVGTATPGFRDRRAVFRDIALQAWMDYLGWSNPIDFKQGIHFGRGRFRAGSDVLEDPDADFSKIDIAQAGTLHVHWGTPTAGVDDSALDDRGGDPNSGVYEIVGPAGPGRLRIRPAAKADGEAGYSIGRRTYYKFRVSNTEFFCLDTRSHRDKHDARNPTNPAVSMIGPAQRAWLREGMAASDADFLFVVSSVNLMVPHVGAGGMNVAAGDKDDAWTAFLHEREELIKFWDGLGKPVFVLTGDLHNSFVVKVTDRVWEMAAGPHNSRNHPASSEGGRPASGPYDSRGRPCEIRWSTWFLDESPRDLRRRPVFCVVQVNNVFPNPVEGGRTVEVAFPRPQAVFQYHDGMTGDLLYAESVPAAR